MRRIVDVGGRKVMQHFTGADPTPRAMDRPHLWETLEIDAEGNPYAYRVSEDITLGVSATGAHLIRIAGVTFGIPDEQLEGLEAALAPWRKAVKDKRAELQEQERIAAEAAAEAERAQRLANAAEIEKQKREAAEDADPRP